MTTPTTWLSQVKAAGLPAALVAAGYRPRPPTNPRHVSPCPACGADQRGTQDSRGPVGLRRDLLGWRCHACGVGGDAVTFVAYHLTGRPLDRDNWVPTRDWCAERGLCDDPGSGRSGRSGRRNDGSCEIELSGISPDPEVAEVAPVAAVAAVAEVAGVAAVAEVAEVAAVANPGGGRPGRTGRTPAPDRPDPIEVVDLWLRGTAVLDDAPTVAWLESRGIDPAAVLDLDLARVIAATGPLPRWTWGQGTTWRMSGHRLLFPLLGPTGQVESLRARFVPSPTLTTPRNGAKTMAARDCALTGVVLADALAQLMLAGEELADGTPAPDEVRRVGLVVVEGEPDFLTWATRWSGEREDAPAVIGILSGTWTVAIAARVPTGTRVAIRTHADRAGNEYAQRVIGALRDRCTCFRYAQEGTT